MAKKKKAAKKSKASKGSKKSSKGDTRRNKLSPLKEKMETTPSGNPTKIWCQFYASQDEKAKMHEARGILGFHSYEEWARARLLEEALKIVKKK